MRMLGLTDEEVEDTEVMDSVEENRDEVVESVSESESESDPSSSGAGLERRL